MRRRSIDLVLPRVAAACRREAGGVYLKEIPIADREDFGAARVGDRCLDKARHVVTCRRIGVVAVDVDHDKVCGGGGRQNANGHCATCK